MPTPQATHVDPVLSNVSVEYQNNEFVAKRLFPVMPVAFPAGKYVKFSKKNRFKVGKSVLTANTPAPKIDWVPGYDNYSVTYHAWGKAVSEISRQWAASGVGQAVDLETYSTQICKDTLLLEYENEVATQATTAATYGSNYSTPSTSWDETGATVIADIKAAIKACHKRPNTMIIGRDVFDVLTEDSGILGRIQYSERGIITADLLSALFDVPSVIVASALSEVGGDYLWGSNVVLAYVESRLGPEALTFGLTFSPDGEDFIRNYTDDTIGRGAQVIEAHWAWDVKVVAQECGYLLKDVLSGS